MIFSSYSQGFLLKISNRLTVKRKALKLSINFFNILHVSLYMRRHFWAFSTFLRVQLYMRRHFRPFYPFRCAIEDILEHFSASLCVPLYNRRHVVLARTSHCDVQSIGSRKSKSKFRRKSENIITYLFWFM